MTAHVHEMPLLRTISCRWTARAVWARYCDARLASQLAVSRGLTVSCRVLNEVPRDSESSATRERPTRQPRHRPCKPDMRFRIRLSDKTSGLACRHVAGSRANAALRRLAGQNVDAAGALNVGSREREEPGRLGREVHTHGSHKANPNAALRRRVVHLRVLRD